MSTPTPDTPAINTPAAPLRKRARTKIVATVGPACREEEKLVELIEAGVSVFRLNMAHGSIEEHTEIIERIRHASATLDVPVAVLVDLSGPKIRLGELPDGKVECEMGDRYDFIRGDVTAAPNEFTCTYEGLVDELKPGDTVMLADGTVSMLVQKKSADRVECCVTQRGAVRSRQGINLPGVKLSVPTLGKEDIQHAIWAAQVKADFVSLSFVRSPDDVRQLRQLLRAHESDAHVVAKIEKAEALECLEEVVTAADAVMVARGDLGVEIDVATVPMEQKRIIAMCRRLQRPVIIATQMLESMHHSRRPTRAEVSDVANAIMDGGDACMLSGETAIGEFPRDAVAMMQRIAVATEDSLKDRIPAQLPEFKAQGVHQITQSVVYGASAIARRLDAKLVVVASHSGATALALSGQRGYVPAIGVSAKESTLRHMCLYWGVTPLRGLPARDINELMRHADDWGISTGHLVKGDKIVLVGGSHLTAGVHDILIVHEVGTVPVI
jgi:pyruvate kinase